ncbi:MAG TPA: hypothetical protein VNJ52_04740 [Patescibacteria group bacterium]|nr:hypothetical protein [Patescibacteria group bacterium]
MDSVARITNAFWKELGRIEKLIGIRREVIALTLARLNEEKKRTWEAKLWRAGRSRDAMEMWVLQERANYDEDSLLELAGLLPEWARRSLASIIEKLPPPNGGKRRALYFREERWVKRRFQELTQHANANKRLSARRAYSEISRQVETKFGKKASPHTIRTICDARERERNRKKPKRLALISL